MKNANDKRRTFFKSQFLEKFIGLQINLYDKSVTLKLRGRAGIVDFVELPYYHNLDGVLTPLEVSAIRKRGFIIKGGQEIYGELLTVLISGLDKLLKKNKMSPEALKTYEIRGKLSENSTSHKIASAFVQALKFNY